MPQRTVWPRRFSLLRHGAAIGHHRKTFLGAYLIVPVGVLTSVCCGSR